MGEHLPCKQGVESSNLFISIKFGKRFNGKKVLTKERKSFIITWLTKQPEDEKANRQRKSSVYLENFTWKRNVYI